VSLVEAIATLILVLVVWETCFWVLKKGLLGIALFRLRLRLRRQLPVGHYRWERPNSIAVGKPDTLVVFKMRLQPAAGRRPAMHVAVSDSRTRFSVGDQVVAVDPFLEAYDDERGPLEVQVYEVGKIGEIGIDTRAQMAIVDTS
jgi:hypothetical protein